MVAQTATIEIDGTTVVDSPEIQAHVAARPLLGDREVTTIDERLIGIDLAHDTRETRLNGEWHQNVSLIVDVLN